MKKTLRMRIKAKRGGTKKNSKNNNNNNNIYKNLDVNKDIKKVKDLIDNSYKTGRKLDDDDMKMIEDLESKYWRLVRPHTIPGFGYKPGSNPTFDKKLEDAKKNLSELGEDIKKYFKIMKKLYKKD